MKIVLDASAAIPAFVPEADTLKALRLLDEYRQGIHELLAPDFFVAETSNALLMAEFQGRLGAGESEKAILDLLNILPVLQSSVPLIPRAHEIAAAYRIAIYDVLYIALAERENAKLVTTDDKMIKKLQGQFPFIQSLSTFLVSCWQAAARARLRLSVAR
jgi:predicted nucleic acid-binding protein